MTSMEETTATRIPIGSWGREVARIGIALVVAVNVGLQCGQSIPSSVPTTTDIVGYPGFNGFDPFTALNTYLVWVIGVPAVAWATYGLLTLATSHFAARGRETYVTITRPGSLDTAPFSSLAGLCARVGLVTSVLALELMIWGRQEGMRITIGVLLAGVAAGLGSRLIAKRRGRRMLEVATAAGSVGVLAGLYLVSRSTAVYSSELGRLSHTWLPFWLAALLSFLAGLLAYRAWQRYGPSPTERFLVLFLTGSIGVFLLTARLPGLLGAPNLFDDGERLAGAELLLDGRMPWRDFLSVHGLMDDSFFAAVGFKVFDNSWWGFEAAISMLARPLFLVGFYVFAVTLLRGRWVGMLAVGLGIVLQETAVAGLLAVPHHRLLLVHFVFALYLVASRTPRPWVSAALTSLTFGFVVTAPEVGFIVAPTALMLLLSDLNDPAEGRRLWSRLPRTKAFVFTGAVLTAAFAGFLASVGALDDFIYAIISFSRDHQLTGTSPINWPQIDPDSLVFLPPVLVAVTLSIVGLKQRHRCLGKDDIAVAAIALFELMYYWKFLARPDRDHVRQAWVAAAPLLIYLAHQGVTAVERLNWNTIRLGGGGPGSQRVRAVLWFGIIALMTLPSYDAWQRMHSLLDESASRFQPAIAEPFLDGDLSYVYAGYSGVNEPALNDLDLLLHPRDSEPPSLFDFTNTPGLYHYLLHLPTVTRYYHVSTAIREDNQLDLIDDLEREMPDVVVWRSLQFGLGTWDGITNAVRHYRVSEWILRHYEPWVDVGGQLLMKRIGAVPPVEDIETLPFAGPVDMSPWLDSSIGPCDWGQSGERLPVPSTSSEPATIEPVDGAVIVTGWAATRDHAAREILVLVDGQVVAHGLPTEVRPDVAETVGYSPDLRTGFVLNAPYIGDPGQLEVEVVAIWDDDTYSYVGDTLGRDASDARTEIEIGGRLLPANEGPAVGDIERIDVAEATEDGQVRLTDEYRPFIARMTLPSDAAQGSFVRLESSGFVDAPYDRFSFTSVPGDGDRSIRFKSVGNDPEVIVPVANCPQWHQLRTDFVYLMHDWPLPDLRAAILRRTP